MKDLKAYLLKIGLEDDEVAHIEFLISCLLKQQREICASVDITDNFRIKQFTIPQSNAILNAPEPTGEIK